MKWLPHRTKRWQLRDVVRRWCRLACSKVVLVTAAAVADDQEGGTGRGRCWSACVSLRRLVQCPMEPSHHRSHLAALFFRFRLPTIRQLPRIAHAIAGRCHSIRKELVLRWVHAAGGIGRVTCRDTRLRWFVPSFCKEQGASPRRAANCSALCKTATG
jgi:hypothetical protein